MIAFVSGSGLNLRGTLDRVDAEIGFRDAGIPAPSLEGHERTFVRGSSGGIPVVLQAGRLHFYEGLDYATVTSTVDYLYTAGVRAVLFTNVVGGLKPDMLPGEIVAIRRLRTWPYFRWEHRPESLTPDLTIDGCDREGEYMWMHGPSYETPAEIRLLRRWGADVVGMSTAPEVQRCQELGIPTAVVSCITNNCCQPHVLTHDDVVKQAQAASNRLVGILRKAIQTLALD